MAKVLRLLHRRFSALHLFWLLPLTVVQMRCSRAVESMTFFHPESSNPVTPHGYEDVWVTTNDNVKLHGWYLKPANMVTGQRSPAILHCHGNGGDISNHVDSCNYLPESGIGVLIFDYRGYGRSDPARRLDRKQVLRDCEAAYTALKARPDVDPEHLGVMGYSLGGNFALQLALNHPEIRSVVCTSTFSSWPGVAGDFMPIIGPMFIPSGMSGVDALTQIGARTTTKPSFLFLHGGQDLAVNSRHSVLLDDAAKKAGLSTTLHIVPDAGHVTIYTPQVEKLVTTFFTDHLGMPR